MVKNETVTSYATYTARAIYIYSLSTFLQPYLLRRQCFVFFVTVVWTLCPVSVHVQNGEIQCMTSRHDIAAANVLHPRLLKFRWDFKYTLNLTF